MKGLVFAAALYLIAPGHPDAFLNGLPLGQAGTSILILLIAAWAWTRGSGSPRPRPVFVQVVVVAIVLKVAVSAVTLHSGWLAEYYANDQFTPPVQRSLDFRDLTATRIDRELRFVDTQFPVHFFNSVPFNFGVRREETEPFSVRWRGYVHNDEPLTLAAESRGDLEMLVDDRPADPTAAVGPGEHVIEVRYRKPRNTQGLVLVGPRDAGGSLREWRAGEVTPLPASASRRAMTRMLVVVAWVLHAIVAAVLIAGAGPSLAAKARAAWLMTRANPVQGLHHWVAPVVLVGLTAQGFWKSRHLVGHVWTLTGGDDWWAFESNARDVVLNGWLMNNGAATGGAFNVYPGYGYFLGAVHVLTGESLAGVVLANFVALAAATIFVYGLARMLTTPLAAYVAVGWVLALEQLDFVRYYTVTLLSENLFFLLVAATLYLLVRFTQSRGWWWLAGGAVCGGLATATRPTMLLYLPVVAVVIGGAVLVRDGWRRGAAAALLLATLWMIAISPITLRNYLVSGSPVLVTAGQGRTFLDYNLPPGGADQNLKYYQSFSGTNLSALKTLLWILWDHPEPTLRLWGFKVAFSLGMVHWMGNTPHPELVLTSVLYLTAIVLVPAARSSGALIVHAFVVTHLATLLLTTPWNYGYRMLLAMFMVMPIFVGALFARPLEAWLLRRRPAGSAAPA